MSAPVVELRNVPKQARAQATLTAIVEAARQAADQHGYDRFTTAQVSKLSGYSIGTVYRYFPNRIGLLEAIDNGRKVAADVRAERARQDVRWGVQNHSDGTGVDTLPLHTTGGERELEEYEAFSLAQIFQRSTDDRFSRTRGDRPGTWADILLEEVFEALAEEDPARLRAELIQVAAVAQQWVSAIDRRAPREQEVAA